MSINTTSSEGARRHALIVSGGTEEARRAEALRLAAEALCLSEAESRPCGRCAACRKLYGVGHVDVLFLLTPPEDKVMMPVGLVRRLRSEMYVRPNEG
ncbi:MAG: DNA polymerase III subunit delta', partial [Oscillospiraceae bacterium]|nr:DNA polymerase III subunit delta' [Oscillospiraceae bacterium]